MAYWRRRKRKQWYTARRPEASRVWPNEGCCGVEGFECPRIVATTVIWHTASAREDSTYGEPHGSYRGRRERSPLPFLDASFRRHNKATGCVNDKAFMF